MNAETLPKAVSSPAFGTSGASGGSGTWRFDRFELDLQRGTLCLQGGEEVALRPKTFALLCHLVAHPGRLISKDELLDTVWPDVVVTEDSVVQCIGELRAALGDRAQQLIKTVPRRGYLLQAAVQQVPPSEPPAVADAPAASVVAPGEMPGAPPAAPAQRRFPRRAVGAALLAVALLGSLLAWWWPAQPVHIDGGIAASRAIAVLPFADLSEPASPGLTTAVAQDVTMAVAHLAETLVFASTSTSGFTGRQADVRAAGRVLGATHVLTGSVQRNGASVVVRAQLQRADDAAVLWSERFEYAGSAPWEWQRDIAQRMANALDTQLHNAHFTSSLYTGQTPGAIEATQQAFWLIRNNKTREDVLRARALVNRALATDPDSAVALFLLGMTHAQELQRRWSTDREGQIELASRAFERAIALRPDYAQPYYGRANVLFMRGQVDAAVQACEQALERWPNEPRCLQALGHYRLQQGRPEEVAAPIELSLRLNPLESNQVAWGHFYLGMAQFHLHHDDVAYEEMRKVVAANPDNAFGWQWMAAIDALHGREQQARANLEVFSRITPGQSVSSLKATEASKNPAFWAERERFYEGLRQAGLPQ